MDLLSLSLDSSPYQSDYLCQKKKAVKYDAFFIKCNLFIICTESLNENNFGLKPATIRASEYLYMRR